MSTHHVIIGSGPAATNAAESIRRFTPHDPITLIADELAHSRMAIPYWLAGAIPREQTHTGDAAYFQRLGVATRWGTRVTQIDTAARRLELADGASQAYDTLLLATGSRPLTLPIPGIDLPGVQPMWRLEDAERALARLEKTARPRVALIGAGFIGLIILNALYKRGAELTVIERESQVLPRMLPAQAAQLATTWLAGHGVAVFAGSSVAAITADGTGMNSVQLSDGASLGGFDLIVVAVGVEPNLELARGAGIDTDQGILVDTWLRTNVPGIFAAGDVVQGPVLWSDRRELHAIQPTAVDHGRVAGANMAGKSMAYPGSLSMNVLDVCGLQCASFGDWSNTSAPHTMVSNSMTIIHREFVWSGDRMTGAVFAGRASDMGMLTDVGMAKGLIQTHVPLGPWKRYLEENPFDVRRAFIASGAATQLTRQSLLGEPALPRDFRYAHSQPGPVPVHYQVLVGPASDPRPRDAI